MTESKSDKTFYENISGHLDQRVSDIDSQTISALRAIRHKALSESARQQWFFSFLLKPKPLVTSLCFALVLSLSLNIYMDPKTTPTPALEDIPLLTAKDDIEFYNDLDFYQWLDVHNSNG